MNLIFMCYQTQKKCNNLTKILKLILSLNINMTSSSDNAIQFGHVHPSFFFNHMADTLSSRMNRSSWSTAKTAEKIFIDQYY